MQSRVLSDSGDSGPGRVGVGVTAAAAVVAAAAAVGGVVEREESTRHTVERADSSTNHTHTKSPDLTFTKNKNQDLTLLKTIAPMRIYIGLLDIAVMMIFALTRAQVRLSVCPSIISNFCAPYSRVKVSTREVLLFMVRLGYLYTVNVTYVNRIE